MYNIQAAVHGDQHPHYYRRYAGPFTKSSSTTASSPQQISSTASLGTLSRPVALSSTSLVYLDLPSHNSHSTTSSQTRTTSMRTVIITTMVTVTMDDNDDNGIITATANTVTSSEDSEQTTILTRTRTCARTVTTGLSLPGGTKKGFALHTGTQIHRTWDLTLANYGKDISAYNAEDGACEGISPYSCELVSLRT